MSRKNLATPFATRSALAVSTATATIEDASFENSVSLTFAARAGSERVLKRVAGDADASRGDAPAAARTPWRW